MDVRVILKALSHPARVEMLSRIKTHAHEVGAQDHPFSAGLAAREFEHMGLSQSTVSAHLATLRAAGLLTVRRIGRWSFYRRDEETIAAFLRH